MNSRSRCQTGFTLIELLVAMLIFAVLGTAAYQGLFQIQRVRDGVIAQSDYLSRLQRSFYWMSEDMAQLSDRPVRTTLGSLLPSFEFSETGESLIEFTRAGWTNPAADILPARSTLQRVAYSLEGDRLIRRYWYHLDRVEDEASKRRLMIDRVASVGMRFLDQDGDWHTSWPPPSTESDAVSLPRAVEFSLELEDFGTVTRLFAPPG